MRTFEDKIAVRAAIPVLLGVSGAQGSGKTWSALRLATGIQRVVGGDIYGCDSENGRMLHYADHFKFRHVPFGAPFSPLDYMEVLQYCEKKGAKTVIIDSGSHCHEGPGGVLEMHDRLTKELAAKWRTTEEKASRSAWIEPKAQLNKLIMWMGQSRLNLIWCFRAKEKSGAKQDEKLGFMPIVGSELAFEMTAMALLYPGSDGVPTWDSRLPGERLMTKLPNQYRALFLERFRGKPLSEDIGEELAKWAAGGLVSRDGQVSISASQLSAPGEFIETTAKPSEMRAAFPSAAFTDDEFTDVMEKLSGSPDVASAKFIANEHRARLTTEQKATVKRALENWSNP